MREDVAIVGIGGIFPDAMDFSEYWSNIIGKKDSVKDISEEYWSLEDFYDSDPAAIDKTYAKKAATVKNIQFDPIEYGIPPKVMQSISVEQFFALVVARQALIDAGLIGKNAKSFDRSRTGVILSAGVGKTSYNLYARTLAPGLFRIMKNAGVPEKVAEHVIDRFKGTLNDWDEACNPGYLSNVVSGRIANRFDFGGTSCNVNAACGSSIASIKYAISELLEGNCDVMLAGGVNLDCTPHTFLAFSKTPAMSKTNKITPFDENADGMILGDGVGIVVLKRLSDAKRDKDRIYAIIKGIGSSSDGRAKSIFSPSKDGQIRAIRNAVINAGIDKESISLIEAHGTGTNKGDVCEAEALKEFFSDDKGQGQNLVIGSVKSQIGHLRMAAGVAGLIKTALALYHKNLPVSLHVKKPNTAILNSNLYIQKRTRPWISNQKNPVRRAGISAFGFGGTNFHAILEEAEPEQEGAYRLNVIPEVVVFSASGIIELQEKLTGLLKALEDDEDAWRKQEYKYHLLKKKEMRLAFVAENAVQVKEKCEIAISKVEKKKFKQLEEDDIYYREASIGEECKVVAMFSGQGAQYVNMFADVACAYPEMRKNLSIVDNIMLKDGKKPISEIIYPLVHEGKEKKQAEKKLMLTSYTQVALAAMESSLFDIVKNRGFQPNFLLGHSFGELSALYADNVFDKETFFKLSMTRGRLMQESCEDCETAMLAVFMEKEKIIEESKEIENLYVANENSQKQTIVSGSLEAVITFEKLMQEKGIKTVRLKVSCAFHSPYMKNASEQFRKELAEVKFEHSTGKVIGNVDGENYQPTKEELKRKLTSQIINPVKFQKCVEKAYEQGGRIYVEFGPGRVLSRLVEEILVDKEVQIISLNADKYEDGTMQLENALAKLYVLGVDIKNDSYRRILGMEYKNRRTKSSFEISPNMFHLEEKKKKIDKAYNQIEEITEEDEKDIVVEKGVENKLDMKDMNDVCKLRELNASVFEHFIKVQNEQIKYIGDMLERSNAKTPEEQKEIFECIKTFQANSMRALEIYFEKQDVREKAVFDYQAERPVVAAGIGKVEMKASIAKEPIVETKLNQQVSYAESAVQEEQTEKIKNTEIGKEEESQAETDTGEIENLILNIISEKTGYPMDIIDKEMELESDLGIDSIKRVEIFSEINEQIGEKLTPEHLEELTFIETVAQVVEFIAKCVSGETV